MYIRIKPTRGGIKHKREQQHICCLFVFVVCFFLNLAHKRNSFNFFKRFFAIVATDDVMFAKRECKLILRLSSDVILGRQLFETGDVSRVLSDVTSKFVFG